MQSNEDSGLPSWRDVAHHVLPASDHWADAVGSALDALLCRDDVLRSGGLIVRNDDVYFVLHGTDGTAAPFAPAWLEAALRDVWRDLTVRDAHCDDVDRFGKLHDNIQRYFSFFTAPSASP